MWNHFGHPQGASLKRNRLSSLAVSDSARSLLTDCTSELVFASAQPHTPCLLFTSPQSGFSPLLVKGRREKLQKFL